MRSVPTTRDDFIIRAEGVVKRYQTGATLVQALRGIDFGVRRGEMVAVMGPSGCGKTTLLNCLSGLDTADEGAIWLDGTDLATMGDWQRTDYRARRMGFVFQVYNLLPVLSAVENVELPLLVSGTRPKEAREKAMASLATVGLAEWAKHRPAELSGGQRQRVTVARALVNDPAIVWGDEPTGALDSKTATEIMDLLRELNERAAMTMVLVTHDPGVGAQCDRIVRMRDGLIVGQLETDRRIYRDLLAHAAETGDEGLARTLRAYGELPYDDVLAYAFIMERYHKLVPEHDAPTGAEERASEVGPWGVLGSENDLIEKTNVLRGLADMFAVTYPQLQGIDFRRDVPRLDVPVYVLLGEYELSARADLSREWFDLLRVHGKQIFTIEDAGHGAAFEAFAQFDRIMTEIVLAETYPVQ